MQRISNYKFQKKEFFLISFVSFLMIIFPFITFFILFHSLSSKTYRISSSEDFILKVSSDSLSYNYISMAAFMNDAQKNDDNIMIFAETNLFINENISISVNCTICSANDSFNNFMIFQNQGLIELKNFAIFTLENLFLLDNKNESTEILIIKSLFIGIFKVIFFFL